MAARRRFRRPRARADLRLMLSVQRSTLAAMAGRLDLLDQQTADALTDQGARLLDLEDRVQLLESRLVGCEELRLPAEIPELPWIIAPELDAGL